MPRHVPRIFTRLRRCRGVWMLALAVLLFKVAMSTFCVMDGPRLSFAVETAGSTLAESDNDARADAVSPDDDYCVLGEGSGCHCTCTHAVALPVDDAVVVTAVLLSRIGAPALATVSPSFPRSPLRPPIA
jgi:hypothetical protein